jgi:hypothetical protein
VATSDGEWRIVDRYVNAIDAHIVRGRLEAEGIPAEVGNEHLVTQNWLWSQAVGGVVIRVPAGRLADAREVIAALDKGEYAQPSSDDTDVCEHCGSSLVRVGMTRELSLFSSFFIGLPLPFRRQIYRCPNCRVTLAL